MRRGKLSSALIACLIAGCESPPTQLVVLVDSDLIVPVELARVEATIRHRGEWRWSHPFPLDEPGDLPFSFGVQPITERPDARFEITLDAIDSGGNMVVTRTAATWLIERETLLLPMFLASRCLSEPACGADETCTEEGCVPSEVDPAGLDRIGAGDELQHVFEVDPRAVDTVILSGPPPLTSSATATFTFAARGLPASAFECAVEGESFTPCTSPFVLRSKAEGAQLFAVRARGPGGELDDSPAEWSWRIDAAPPVTDLSVAPAARTDDRSAHFEFRATEADATFECALDDEPWSTCTSPFVRPSLALGEHAFRVRATDAAGNLEETGPAHAWTIYTFAGGELFRSTTWSADNSPYAIQSAVRVPVGITLTIEAGVRVDAGVADDIQLYGGTVAAVGTREQPIRFRDVRLTRRSPVTIAVGTMQVEHAVFEGGGISAPTGGNAYDRVILRDSLLRNALRIELAYPGGTSYFERNVFERSGGISIATNDGNAFVRNNIFRDPSTTFAVRILDSANDVQKVIVQHNSFMDTSQVNFRLAGAGARADASNNFWNTMDPAVIEQMIWDQADSADVGHVVVYDPVLPDHHASTPAN